MSVGICQNRENPDLPNFLACHPWSLAFSQVVRELTCHLMGLLPKLFIPHLFLSGELFNAAVYFDGFIIRPLLSPCWHVLFFAARCTNNRTSPGAFISFLQIQQLKLFGANFCDNNPGFDETFLQKLNCYIFIFFFPTITKTVLYNVVL